MIGLLIGVTTVVCDELRDARMASSDFDELTILSQWMMDAGC